ncbi:MAG TPA: transglycosylase SLT domain-containing protein, partial [Pyrinomonadaceae bacterium]|nr:transglycosylase SLT domain-containing protein [Pyrinomonadaceae bacterium]
REARLLTAQAQLKVGKTYEARNSFLHILMQMPDASRPDDFALDAVRALDEMEQSGFAKGALTEADRLLRASVYQFNRDFNAARRHYQLIVDQNPEGATAPNALYQIGRGYYLQAKFDEAIRWFQRVIDEFPENTSARDALGFQAASYNRQKRTDEAVATYKRLIQSFPDTPNPERAYINIIDALHEAGRYREALDWVQQTRARFPNQVGNALALFAQFRIHLAQSDWAAVLSDAEELKRTADLGGTRVPSGTSTAEVTFIQAVALERLGRVPEAIDLYLTIPDGRNEYFGQRATARLQVLAASQNSRQLAESRTQSLMAQAHRALAEEQYDTARRLAQNVLRLSSSSIRSEAFRVLKQCYESLPGYRLPQMSLVQLGRRVPVTDSVVNQSSPQAVADELFFLGLYDEAVPAFLVAQTRVNSVLNLEVAAQQTSAQKPSDSDYTIAILSLRSGQASVAVRFGERLWRAVPTDYELELAPDEYVDLLYPVVFRDSLLRHTPHRKIDPRFILAIARQESRFQPEAKSVAAARGMMQFIPETANSTAKELGLTQFQQDDLYNPDTSILFAAEYLALLFRQFPDQPEAVAAAYNGGPDNVARWIARSRSNDPGRYVAEIGFTQTKDYIFRVLTNYRAYRKIYDSQLQRQ